MIVVLDTNVLVSGLLYPFRSSGEIVRMTSAGDLRLCYDARVLAEYRDVLLRPKFSFSPSDVNDFLAQLEACGYAVASKTLARALPDPDDETFLEVAISGKARCLVTGNKKHYPPQHRAGVTVVSPSEFLELYRS